MIIIADKVTCGNLPPKDVFPNKNIHLVTVLSSTIPKVILQRTIASLHLEVPLFDFTEHMHTLLFPLQAAYNFIKTHAPGH